MTKWQWSVFMALLRYTLAMHHYELLIDYKKDLKDKDIALLAEALRRG